MTQRRFFLVPLRGVRPVAAEASHWQSSHAPLFSRTPGLLHYVQYRPLPEEWARGWRHVCSETVFADRSSERAAYASDFYRAKVSADEATFLDRDAAWSARIIDGDPPIPPTREFDGDSCLVVQFGGTRPSGDWLTLQTSREAVGGGSEIHLFRTTDRSEALAVSAAAAAPAFACRPTPIPVRSDER